jgi:hypothetical protein
MKTQAFSWIPVAVAVFLLLPFLGCGSSAPRFGTTPDEVIQLVGCVPDAARSPQSFAAIFSSTSPPDEMKRRQLMQYVFVARSASVSGDDATVKVEVREPVDNETVGEVEWTAVKEGGAWKLKETPLPAS